MEQLTAFIAAVLGDAITWELAALVGFVFILIIRRSIRRLRSED